MEDEKTPPVENKEGQVTPTPKDTGEVADDKLKEAEAKIEKLNKQIKDKESHIGKQSTEIGELRNFKSENQGLIDKVKEATGEHKDELSTQLVESLVKDGMTQEDAEYNAKILTKGTISILDQRDKKRVENDTLDMIEDALDDGKIDDKFYDENKAEINAEFRTRKVSPTARQNFRTYIKCYKDVVKRKADAIKGKEEAKDEKNREALISGQDTPPPGGKTPAVNDEAKKTVDGIKGAGNKKGSNVFF